jgi:hypothetical protein
MTAPLWFCAPAGDPARDFRATLPAEWSAAHEPTRVVTHGHWADLGRRMGALREPETWVLTPPALGVSGAIVSALARLPVQLVLNLTPPPWALPRWHPVWARVPADYPFPAHRALLGAAHRVIVAEPAGLPPVLGATRRGDGAGGEGEGAPPPGRSAQEPGPAPTLVIPDALGKLPAPPRRPLGRPLTLAWCGSPGEVGDLGELVIGLAAYLALDDTARMAFLGAPPSPELIGPRVRAALGWYSLDHTLDALTQLAPDCVLLPLAADPGAGLRGHRAVLLAAAMGAALLVSARGPIAGELRHGAEAYLVEDGQWCEALENLAHAPALREQLAEGLREWVSRRRTLEQTGPLWAAAVR